MPTQRRQRGADSPFVEQITEVAYEEQTHEWATPDGCWDIVVFSRNGVTTVLQTGATLRPVLLENGPGDRFLAISFKPGVFTPRTPSYEMIDRALWRPVVSGRTFALTAVARRRRRTTRSRSRFRDRSDRWPATRPWRTR